MVLYSTLITFAFCSLKDLILSGFFILISFNMFQLVYKLIVEECSFHFARHLFKGWPPYRSSHPEVFCKKGVFRNFLNSQENTCTKVSFVYPSNFFDVNCTLVNVPTDSISYIESLVDFFWG